MLSSDLRIQKGTHLLDYHRFFLEIVNVDQRHIHLQLVEMAGGLVAAKDATVVSFLLFSSDCS